MRWERPFLGLAALNNAAWAVLVVAAPASVFHVLPPALGAFALLIVGVGACFAANAVRPVPVLLSLGLLAKALGPLVFLGAVARGYVRPASWPLVLVTDLVWIPPLLVLWRRRGAW